MQAILYRLASLDELAALLEAAGDDHEIAIEGAQHVRDGDWILATFSADAEATSLAGRVRERGSALRLTFEPRDWELLRRFALGQAPPSIPPPSHGSRSDSVTAPHGATALIVETDPTVQAVVATVLEGCGVSALTAPNAEDALDLLRVTQVDGLVLELALDGMDGLELCRRVRAEPRLSGIPILVLAASSSAADVREALRAGADDFVAKPFRAHELRARLLCLLHRVRAAG